MASEAFLTDVTNVLSKKFQEVLDIQEEHARKLVKENQTLRAKLTSLIKQAKPSKTENEPCVLASVDRDNSDPIWVGDFDLMTLVPDQGPSQFGRCLAVAVFGSDDQCALINERVGAKLLKENSRKPCDSTLEEKFKNCVARNFSNNVSFAMEKALNGANQYGAEMRKQFPEKKVKKAREDSRTVGLSSNKENEEPIATNST